MTLDPKAVDAAWMAFRGSGGHLETAISRYLAFTEATAPSGQAPLEGVKALEWRHTGIGTHYAETPFGKYCTTDGGTWWFGKDTDKSCENLFAAKAAAQADYEARIRSALLPASAEPVGWQYRYPNYERGTWCDWTFTKDETIARETAHTDGEYRALGVIGAHANAEPVAWRWRWDADQRWSYGPQKPQGMRFGDPDEIEPLYASPPANGAVELPGLNGTTEATSAVGVSAQTGEAVPANFPTIEQGRSLPQSSAPDRGEG